MVEELVSGRSLKLADVHLTTTAVLVFLRAPRSQILETSTIFFDFPNASVTESALLRSPRLNSLHQYFIHSLLESDSRNIDKQDRLAVQVILPYIMKLTGCCKAKYDRVIQPLALKSFCVFRIDENMIFDEIQQLLFLRRQVEAFLARFDTSRIDPPSKPDRGRESCRLLCEVIGDLKDLLSFFNADKTKWDSEYLRELFQKQIDEAKEARNTSVKLEYLSQLAYIFLPLQLATSAMGMNLKNFGTGNIELRTFLLMLAGIATLSFVPAIVPLLGIPERVRQTWSIWTYSRRVSFLFGWFCLFHEKSLNMELWYSGIDYDLHYFRGSYGPRRGQEPQCVTARITMTAALRRQYWISFPQYWQTVLNEIYDIIDRPRWGRADQHLHTA